MLKGFMGIFKKDNKNTKKEEKEKLPQDLAVEIEKEDANEKQIDDLINSNELNVNNKNSAYYLFLEKDDERKITTEVVKETLHTINSEALWEAFLPMLQKWE
jgi:transcriptional regulator NrdR family protein